MRRSTEIRHATGPGPSPASDPPSGCPCYFDEDGFLVYRDRSCPWHGWW